MKYLLFDTIRSFGEELKEKVLNRVDRDSIGDWASDYTSTEFNDDTFTRIVESVYLMSMDPGFLLSYKELNKIADNAITGKWIAKEKI